MMNMRTRHESCRYKYLVNLQISHIKRALPVPAQKVINRSWDLFCVF